MKFGTIVLQVNMHQMMEAYFWYDIILSEWWPWWHFTQKSAALVECTCNISRACAAASASSWSSILRLYLLSGTILQFDYMLCFVFILGIVIHIGDTKGWILSDLWTPNLRLAYLQLTKWHMITVVKIRVWWLIKLSVEGNKIHLFFIKRRQLQMLTRFQSGQDFWAVMQQMTEVLCPVSQCQPLWMKTVFQLRMAAPPPTYYHLRSVHFHYITICKLPLMLV